jgi:signal transduction histidine kinase
VEGSAPRLPPRSANTFERNAPQLALKVAATLGEFARFLREGAHADAVVIGPTPANTRPLDILRQLRTETSHLPAILLSARNDGETAIAAFQLGAQDYILQKQDYLTDLVFSLNNILRRADTERQNVRLTHELEQLNHSLEAQVAARTAELQALSLRLLQIQEDERRAIARELHDQIGQMLTGLKFQLEAATAQAGPAAQEKLSEATATATDLMRHVRELTQLYRPRVLDDLGLQPALEWHAKQFQRQTGITLSLDLALPAARLPSELETVIFRITQEALTNVARHSGAKAAAISITHDAEFLHVEISDQGRGFELAPVLARRDAIGLAGVRERVHLAGKASSELVSQPGHGTRLNVTFPLPSPRSRMTTTIIADDHEIVRRGLRSLLESHNCRIIAEAADGLAAAQAVEKLKPNLLFLDLNMPRLHGLEVLKQVRTSSPGTRVIVLSMHNDEPYVIEALRAGAAAYLLKGSESEDIAQKRAPVRMGPVLLSKNRAINLATTYSRGT